MSPVTGSVKRSVLASWAAHVVSLMIGFFLMPFVIKTLGDSYYGSWVFINSFASYAGLLYLGFGDTISRYVAKYHSEGRPEQVNAISSLVFYVYLAMAGVALTVAGVIAAIAPWLSDWPGLSIVEVRLVIIVLGLNVAVGLVGSVFGGVLMGLRRFDLERGVSFSSDIARLVMIVVFLRREWGILTIATIYLFITFAEQVAYYVLARRILPELRIQRKLLNWDTARESSSFSSMAFVNAIAQQIIYATDSIVIGIVLGAEAIVPYYVALRLTQFIRQPIDKISHVLMPTAGAMFSDADRPRLQRLIVKALGVVVLLIGGMLIGAWFFGGDVIRTWVGEGYDESHRILCILLGAQLVALPCSVLRAFLFGLGQVRWPAMVYMMEAVVNLTLSIVLCNMYGIVGVAWGTLIPIVLMELFLLGPFALKYLGISWYRLLDQTIRPQLPALGALAGYSYWVANQPWERQNWPMLIAISLGGGATLGGVWLLSRRFTERLSWPVGGAAAK